MFVYDCPDDEDVRHLGHLVNPKLVEVDGITVRGPEGCLSLPGLEAVTPRFDHAVVEGVNVEGSRYGSTAPAGSPAVCSTNATTSKAPSTRTG